MKARCIDETLYFLFEKDKIYNVQYEKEIDDFVLYKFNEFNGFYDSKSFELIKVENNGTNKRIFYKR